MKYVIISIAVAVLYGVIRLDMAASSLYRIAAALDELVNLKRRN